jgi:phosphoribosylaminoimidazolecarboxamide formyltransferase / IMP cyclohydrolase
MADELVSVKRALISVSDKSGLAEFATALQAEFGVELLSTGGTAKFLRDAGLKVIDVSDVTGFPEMMDGRVKTLHPKVHGGLLALRDNAEHVAAMKAHDIRPIDLVCINLYPFKQTIEKPGVTFEHAIENIDIGGPSMVRSAAKNHRFVAVVTAPQQYDKVLGDLRQHGGSTCAKHRLKLAQKAFQHTHEYDGMIASYLAGVVEGGKPADASADLPQTITLQLSRQQSLRYGENPHQKAALYVPAGSTASGSASLGSGSAGSTSTSAGASVAAPSVARAQQLHGKELSYINLLDADAALMATLDLAAPAACVVKHATPCGYATGADVAHAFAGAYASDPVAAFGGIVALNRTVDLACAQAIVEGNKFLEVIVAPGYASDALELLKQRWKNCRLLDVGDVPRPTPGVASALGREFSMHKIAGGMLVQEMDRAALSDADIKVVSTRQPTEAELRDLKLAWAAVKHVKSNAIVIAKDQATVGIGGGQVDRVGASRIAIEKAGDRARGAVVASDAFFPFPDGPKLLLDAGVTAIIHPGGSVRDQETIDLVNARGAAMILTGRRHFRH